MLKGIVAVDRCNGIGYNNNLLFHIPEDMKFFRQTTMGNVVVMGRKTFESMGSKPLKGRNNIVITSKDSLKNIPDIVCGSIEEVDKIIKIIDDRDIFIIGGSSVYEHYIDQCSVLYITVYYKKYDKVDSYFPSPYKHGFHFDRVIHQGKYDDHAYKITQWLK